MARPTTTPEPNSALLSHACDVAFEQHLSKLANSRERYKGNEAAQKAFDELENFFNPRLTTLVLQMKAASSLETQKGLILQMMRDSYNEMVMVSGSPDIANVSNGYLNDMSHIAEAYLEQSHQGNHTAKLGKRDLDGVFHAIENYSGCLNIVSDEIGPYPALEVRKKHGMPMGPVTDAQRTLLLKESEDILRKMGEPLTDEHMPFQPDMLSVVLALMQTPEHFQDMMRSAAEGAASMPTSTIKKWQTLQRDYPDMATNPESVSQAAEAVLIGRGRASVH